MLSNSKSSVKIEKIDPDSSWGLNIVNTLYTQEVGKINDSLDKLTLEKAQNTRLEAECAFSVAGNIMLEKTIKSATDVAGGSAGLYASRGAASIEKECSSEINSIDKQIKSINEKLEKASPEEKENLLSEKDKLKSKKERLTNRIQNAHTTANMKMGVYKGISDGVGGLFEGMAQSNQNIASANKAIFDTQKNQTDQSIQSTMSILNALTSADYVQGLITISSIHLVA